MISMPVVGRWNTARRPVSTPHTSALTLVNSALPSTLPLLLLISVDRPLPQRRSLYSISFLVSRKRPHSSRNRLLFAV